MSKIIITPKQQLELFEWETHVTKLRSLGKDLLLKLNDLINFEYFMMELEKIVKRTCEGLGRPSFDVVLLDGTNPVTKVKLILLLGLFKKGSRVTY